MNFRSISAAAVFVIAVAGGSRAQEILFTNNSVYLNASTSPATPRVSLHGYLTTVTQKGSTYQYVGVVLSNSFSTYNDVFNPPAGSPGTTFGYAVNSQFGPLPSSQSWQTDMALPATTLSSDPSNPTYFTATFYLVNKNGQPYNNAPFSTYCFMAYTSAGKVVTSPAGGPYFAIEPPTSTGQNAKDAKNNQVSGENRFKMLPLPATQETNLNGFWDVRPASMPTTEIG
jgi:hypothetical protein